MSEFAAIADVTFVVFGSANIAYMISTSFLESVIVTAYDFIWVLLSAFVNVCLP